MRWRGCLRGVLARGTVRESCKRSREGNFRPAFCKAVLAARETALAALTGRQRDLARHQSCVGSHLAACEGKSRGACLR